MRFYRLGLSLALLLADCRVAVAWISPAPDVVLYCTPAMDRALQQVADAFRADTGVEVHIFVAPPDGLIGLIRHRARDDVVVADAATIAALAAADAVRRESVTVLGRDPFVLINKASAPLPAGAGVAALVAAFPTVRPDATTAASFDGASVLHADPQAGRPMREIGVSDTPTVVAMVREESGLLGLVHATEAHAPGVIKAATLQVPPTDISGAVVTLGQSANAGRFLAYLAGPSGEAMLREAGLEAKS